jgi:hypothetical protein
MRSIVFPRDGCGKAGNPVGKHRWKVAAFRPQKGRFLFSLFFPVFPFSLFSFFSFFFLFFFFFFFWESPFAKLPIVGNPHPTNGKGRISVRALLLILLFVGVFVVCGFCSFPTFFFGVKLAFGDV